MITEVSDLINPPDTVRTTKFLDYFPDAVARNEPGSSVIWKIVRVRRLLDNAECYTVDTESLDKIKPVRTRYID